MRILAYILTALLFTAPAHADFFISGQVGGAWIHPDRTAEIGGDLGEALSSELGSNTFKVRSKRGLAYGGEAGWRNKNWRFNIDILQSGNDLTASKTFDLKGYNREWEESSEGSIDAKARLSMTQMFVEGSYHYPIGAFSLYGSLAGGPIREKLTGASATLTQYGKSQSIGSFSDSHWTYGGRVAVGGEYDVGGGFSLFAEGGWNWIKGKDFDLGGTPVGFGDRKVWTGLVGGRFTF